MFGNIIIVAVEFGAATGAEIMHISFHVCSLNLMKCIKKGHLKKRRYCAITGRKTAKRSLTKLFKKSICYLENTLEKTFGNFCNTKGFCAMHKRKNDADLYCQASKSIVNVS